MIEKLGGCNMKKWFSLAALLLLLSCLRSEERRVGKEC